MGMDLKAIEDDVRRMELEIERVLNLSADQSEVLIDRHGSIRGRKFLVHNTIRRMKQRNTWKRDYIAEEEEKVVVYMTSCGVVRCTWERCRDALELLNNLNIRTELRDLNLDTSLVDELINRLGLDPEDRQFVYDSLPLVYVNGHYFGNANTLQEWNDQGGLANALRDYYGRVQCDQCGGMGYTLCSVCRGSKKSSRAIHSVILRCTKCDENGIVPCMKCLSR